MLDHILVQVERFVSLPANAKFQDAASPKLSKNAKNAKFQEVTRTRDQSQVIGVVKVPE